MTRYSFILFILLNLLYLPAFAENSHYGASFSYPVLIKDPASARGYLGSVFYQPQSLIWKHASLYFNTCLAHFYLIDRSYHHCSTNILTVAPVARIYLRGTLPIFAEISIGPSLTSKTRLGKSNLGICFLFQDYIGLGILFGKEKHWQFSIGGMHYSNASLADNNGGINIPLILNIGYRFA